MSEWRQGEVDSTEDSGTVVIKPLAGQGQQVRGLNAEEEAEEEEEEDEGALDCCLLASLFRLSPACHATYSSVHATCGQTK